jgi:release factor glutamine methyltransferase
MHTVLELIQLTSDYFAKKQIESPRLNAELLLAHVLHCKRLELYLMFDKPIQEAELTQYRSCIKQRAERMPLQYIMGEVEFYGFPFKVSPAALIPRQETEILVEKANALATAAFTEPRILDIGCGSGIIPISLARLLPNAKLSAVDISTEAIALSRQNAELNSVTDRIIFYTADIAAVDAGQTGTFDMIVSNPPYVSKEEFPTLQEEIVKYEPAIAVTDSGDGYSFYHLITEKSKQLLNSGGYLLFEMGIGQSEKITGLLEANGFSEIIVHKDYQNIDRVIQGKRS